jgi:CheY-like chemotaxis protein
MDGLEAIRTIRMNETLGRIPIVAVTASAFEEDRRQVEEAGGDGFVSKPFRESELLHEVSRCLGLQYVYESDPAVRGGEVAGEALSTSCVPLPLREALRAAVVAADLDRIRLLAAELEQSHPDCAAAVRDLAERFEYDRLLAQLAPGIGSAS